MIICTGADWTLVAASTAGASPGAQLDDIHMTDPTAGPRIDALLTALAARDPVAYDLGTPMLDTAAAEFQELLKLGTRSASYLLAAARSGPAPKAVWAVRALGELSDTGVLDGLRALRAQYQARQTPTMWDFAVIGQLNMAIARLESLSPGDEPRR
jgi:hypothetical protein